MTASRPFAIMGMLLGLTPAEPVQSRAEVEQERREFAAWLQNSAHSPRRAVGVFPVGPGLSLGAAPADVALPGVAAARIEERDGRVVLRRGQTTIALVRGRPTSVGKSQLVAGGLAGRATVTVFDPDHLAGKDPAWFPYDSALALPVSLEPAPAAAGIRLLAPDGVEVEAGEAGSVRVTLRGRTHTLTVRRLPGASEDEAELEVYFRDASNGRSSYPAGRFVALIPRPGGRYLLDFNRARNPFCAYNTAYPCPAPWRGNALPVAIEAGERYEGGGYTPPLPEA